MRRAALGVIRILLDNDLRLRLGRAFGSAMQGYLDRKNPHVRAGYESWATGGRSIRETLELTWEALHVSGLADFFRERLKVQLRDKGVRHDLIDAVFSLHGQDDLALIVKRVEALGEFLKTEDGASLLIGVRRAINILRDEEKKDKKSYAGAADAKLLREPQEKTLHAAIQKVSKDTAAAINVENFAGAMRALAELRAPVDAFFDKVIVNADDAALRANRLALLSEIRAATLNVADFSKIAG